MGDMADSGSCYRPALPTDQPNPEARPVLGRARVFFLTDHLLCVPEWVCAETQKPREAWSCQASVLGRGHTVGC